MAAIFALPSEVVLTSLFSRFPCREQQIRALSTLIIIRGAPCRNVVLYGLEATGKSVITKALLQDISVEKEDVAFNELPNDQLRYAIIKSAECISARHLLEQTVGAVAKAVQWQGNIGRCENTSQLVVDIGKILESWTDADLEDAGKKRLVLVFDGIDRQRDVSSTLLPALARLGEIIPNLTTIYIVTSPRPNFLHLPGVPHIHFPAYTKPELLHILTKTTPTPELPSGAKDTQEVWARFLPAVYDSLAKHSGRDILSFRSICSRLWPRFITPILEGNLSPTPFSRLLLANRTLFQNDNVLAPSIVTSTQAQIEATNNNKHTTIATQLPHTSRLLLVASYLASYNAPKTDVLHFMKTPTSKARRKKGGGTALSKPGVSKHRKISRKLLGPQAFVLERMLAIYHAIAADASYTHPAGRKIKRRLDREDNGSADLQMGIATLASLRLLVKMGAANAGDALEGGCRYRVAVGWEVVRSVARSVGLEAEDYLAD